MKKLQEEKQRLYIRNPFFLFITDKDIYFLQEYL